MAMATGGYLVDTLWTREFVALAPANLDGDSVDELVGIEGDRAAAVMNQRLQLLEGNVWLPGDLSRAGTGGHPAVGHWAVYVRRDSARLRLLRRADEITVAAGEDNAEPPGWDGAPGQTEIVDLDADGRFEALVAVGTGFDLRPRGLDLVDLEDGRVRWRFRWGPLVRSFFVRDLDRDGRPEVCLGAGAVGNGNFDGGTYDSVGYVTVLAADGRVRWQRRLGRYSSAVNVAPLVGSTGELLGIVAGEQGAPAGGRKQDSIFVLDPVDGRVLARARYGDFNGRLAVARTARGEPRVVLWSRDTLRLLDERLRTVKARQQSGARSVEVAVGRFTGRSQDELAVLTGNGWIDVLDLDLQPIIRIASTEFDEILPVRDAGRTRLLARHCLGNNYRCRLYELRGSPLLATPVSLGWVISGGFLTLLLGFAAVVWLRRRQTGELRAVMAGLTGRAGVVELDRQARVRRCNNRARELLAGKCEPGSPLPSGEALAGLVRGALADAEGADPREMPVALPGGGTVLARATRVRAGALLTLEDISAVDYLRRVQSWLPVAQKLAHGIKNPLTTIGLTAQRLQQVCPAEGESFVESIRDDVERLRKMTDGFMRFANLEPPKLEPVNINEVVQESLARLQAVAPQGIVIRPDLAEGLPEVRLDREQMLVVFGNIVENAVAAMKDKGELAVATRPAAGGESVEVSFSDTGPGIPERYLDKVFEPYFTRKAGGTGLGMAISKRIVEDHGGSIKVDSEEGKGTTVTVRLPVGPETGTGMA